MLTSTNSVPSQRIRDPVQPRNRGTSRKSQTGRPSRRAELWAALNTRENTTGGKRDENQRFIVYNLSGRKRVNRLASTE